MKKSAQQIFFARGERAFVRVSAHAVIVSGIPGKLLPAKDLSLAEIIDSVFEGTGLDYRLADTGLYVMGLPVFGWHGLSAFRITRRVQMTFAPSEQWRLWAIIEATKISRDLYGNVIESRLLPKSKWPDIYLFSLELLRRGAGELAGEIVREFEAKRKAFTPMDMLEFSVRHGKYHELWWHWRGIDIFVTRAAWFGGKNCKMKEKRKWMFEDGPAKWSHFPASVQAKILNALRRYA